MNVKEYCLEMNDRAMSRRESKKLMFRRHAEEQYRERVRTGYCQFDRDDIQVDPDAPVSMTTDDEDTRGYKPGCGCRLRTTGRGKNERESRRWTHRESVQTHRAPSEHDVESTHHSPRIDERRGIRRALSLACTPLQATTGSGTMKSRTEIQKQADPFDRGLYRLIVRAEADARTRCAPNNAP